MRAMLVFDLCETVLITVLLVITIPCACVIYWKLLVVSPFAENFTFKLIAFNGATALLNGVAYLLSFQLTSYPFMEEFYRFVQRNSLSSAVAITNRFFNEMSLYSALFVALNRLKSVLSVRLKGNDRTFFLISIIGSLFLTLPALIDLVSFTSSFYDFFEWGNLTLVIPVSNTTGSEIPSRISNTLSIFISLATLVVNVILVVYLVKERRNFERENRKFNVEIRLMITSVVSYIFYMLFSINTVVASIWRVPFAAGAQFLFLGLSALTPFWCLLIFTPSIRRLAISKKEKVSAVSIGPSFVS